MGKEDNIQFVELNIGRKEGNQSFKSYHIEVDSLQFEGREVLTTSVASEANDQYLTIDGAQANTVLKVRLLDCSFQDYRVFFGGNTSQSEGTGLPDVATYTAPMTKPPIYLQVTLKARYALGGGAGYSHCTFFFPNAHTVAHLQGTIGSRGVPTVSVTFTALLPTQEELSVFQINTGFLFPYAIFRW